MIEKNNVTQSPKIKEKNPISKDTNKDKPPKKPKAANT